MPASLRFIHAADIHLGSPLRATRNAPEPHLIRRSHASIEAWEQLVSYALESQVDFVLLAGDIFDTEQPSYAQYQLFIQGLERLDQADIFVYIALGNHDPYSVWMPRLTRVPRNTFVCAADHADYFVYKKNGEVGAIIAGRSLDKDNSFAQDAYLHGMSAASAIRHTGHQSPFVIGLAHTGLTIDRATAPTSTQQLYASNMDYWALGHIHKPWVDNPKDPHIAYPGCLQGRDIGEPGVHGFYLAQLNEGHPITLEFVPLTSLVWDMCEVEISDTQSLYEVQALIEQTLEKRRREEKAEYLCARVSLRGSSELVRELSLLAVREDMAQAINMQNKDIFCESIRNTTHGSEASREADPDYSSFAELCDQQAQALYNDMSRQQALLDELFKQYGSYDELLARVGSEELLNRALSSIRQDLYRGGGA